MDVTLPSGLVITGIPDGTSKEEIMEKAIANGFATAADFETGTPSGPPTTTEFDIEQAAIQELQRETKPAKERPPGAKRQRGQPYAEKPRASPMLAGVGAHFSKVVPNLQKLLSDDPETVAEAQSELDQIEDFLDTLGVAHPETAFSETIAIGSTLPASMTIGGAPAAAAGASPQLLAVAAQWPKVSALMKTLGYGGMGAVEATAFAPGEADIEQQALLGAGLGAGGPLAVKAAPSVFRAGKEVAGKVGDVAGDLLTGATKFFKGDTALKNAVQKSVAEGSDDIQTARYNMEGDKLVKDADFKAAEKQGFDPGTLAVIKSATDATRRKMTEMVDILRGGRKSKRTEYVTRPTDVAGNTLLQRYRTVWNENRKAGKALDKEAEKLKGKPIDFSEPVEQFERDLADKLDVLLDEKNQPIFRGSMIEDVGKNEQILQKVIKRMRENFKNPDAFEVHRLKRFIDTNVNWGTRTEGLDGTVENILKTLRRNLDGVLDTKFPDYNAVNTTYSETRNAINNLQDVAGRKMDLSAPNANQVVGTMLRGLTGNSKARGRLLNSVNELEEVSAKYGAKNEDDLLDIMIFADELDSAFGTQARTSLKGEMLAAGQELAETALRPRLKGPGAVAKAIRTLTGVNEENALKSLEQLLRSRSGKVREEFVTRTDLTVPDIPSQELQL